MTTPEVIAYLDTLERELEGIKSTVRTMKHILFDSLDKDPDAEVE